MVHVHLYGAKPLTESLLTNRQSEPNEENVVELESKFKHDHSGKLV